MSSMTIQEYSCQEVIGGRGEEKPMDRAPNIMFLHKRD